MNSKDHQDQGPVLRGTIRKIAIVASFTHHRATIMICLEILCKTGAVPGIFIVKFKRMRETAIYRFQYWLAVNTFCKGSIPFASL